MTDNTSNNNKTDDSNSNITNDIILQLSTNFK